MADTKDGGGSGMTLDAALATLKTATPAERKAHLIALRAAMDEAGDPNDDDAKKAKEAADAEEEEAKKKAAEDAAEEEAKKKADTEGKDSDLKADDIAKHPNAMDAAEVSKLVAEGIAAAAASAKRRDSLAKQLAPHIGTFDHSEMTESQVAVYGAQKLGITAAKGQESAVLQGYLLAVGNGAKTQVAKTNTAMDASAADCVTAFLNKKEG